MPAQLIGVLLALTSAISWGSGDFSGGYAARRMNQFQVLFLTSIGSLSILITMACMRKESLPYLSDILFAFPAGMLGSLGLVALYRGLSKGDPAIVAPVAGVIGAIFPMFVGILAQGLPGPTQITGFGLALGGIWLVTRVTGEKNKGVNSSLGLAILAGIGFGGFLALIAQVESKEIFLPLVAAKLASIITSVLLIYRTNQSIPRITGNPIALVSGVLDTGGNIFYLYATHFTRLDVVAVLASLYPAWTVVLTYILLKENITRVQWIGIAICTLSIILISL